jgi:hypothetical protein
MKALIAHCPTRLIPLVRMANGMLDLRMVVCWMLIAGLLDGLGGAL